MNVTRYWIANTLGAGCLLLLAGNVALSYNNKSLQADVTLRQQYVQQSVQLEGLYREIIRSLAELGARNNDADVKTMLQKHGISYTVNPAPPAPTAAPRK